VKCSKARQPTETPTSAATKQHDIAIPMFGYKNHAGIARAHGFIRGWTVTSASAHDGAQLRNVVAKDNTASTVWADSTYRSKTNEKWLQDNGLKSDIHQRKPKGKPMPEAMSPANGHRSKIRSSVEHVFARQKGKMKLFIRTIGIGRAKVKIGMANVAYNMLRYVFHESRRATA
jgi:IS5 family transposase